MRSRSTFTLAAALAVFMIAALGQLGAAQPGTEIVREPVLNVDVTGGTLTGPIHSRYTVYNSGLVTFSDASGLSGASSAGTTGVPAGAIDQLQKDLEAAGAFKLPDQSITVSDVPLTTITVFRGGTNARAHTFSYWLAIDDYAAVGSVIDDFSATYIPSSF